MTDQPFGVEPDCDWDTIDRIRRTPSGGQTRGEADNFTSMGSGVRYRLRRELRFLRVLWSWRPSYRPKKLRTTSVTVSIAPGELIDKITIFEIKAKRITGSDSGQRSSERGRTSRRRPRRARRKTAPIPIRRGRHDHLFSPWSRFQSASFGSSSASSSTPVRGTIVNRQNHRHDVPHGDVP